jgi:signal transduction histidine kinase
MHIRTRMSLWYFATSVALLLIFGLLTFFSSRHLAFRALDREHEVIAASIEGRYDRKTNTFKDLDDVPYHVDRNLKESYMIVYDDQEKPVFQSPMAKKFSLPIQLVKQDKKSKRIIEHPIGKVHAFATTDENNVRLLAVSRKLYVDEQEVGWLVIATPVEDIHHAARLLLISLIGGGVLVGMSAGLWSYYLTKRNLRPLSDITAAARRISSANLSESIHVEHKHDEIGQLVTVLNDLLERLRVAFDSQRRFVADGAHELKTPLAVVRSHWEEELNNPDLPREVKEKLVGDIEAITRLTRVINNLLLLSQTEFVESGFDMTSVHLDELLRDLHSDTEVLAGMKMQDLTVSAAQPAVVRGDRDRLYQLFFNIIDNAVKFTPEKGKIAVSLTVENGEALTRVEDTGAGIPDADLPHVFERFYRVGKDRSIESGGSGLGLSICKMIAESHKGSITVASVPGEGSTFTVRLPIDPSFDAA